MTRRVTGADRRWGIREGLQGLRSWRSPGWLPGTTPWVRVVGTGGVFVIVRFHGLAVGLLAGISSVVTPGRYTRV